MTRTRTAWMILVAALAGFPAGAFADDEEPAQVQDGLEEPGLQEKAKRTERAEEPDPDSGLNSAVDARRREVQEMLNKFQEEVGNKKDDLTPGDAKAWDKIVQQADKLVQGFLADNEKYLETHRGLLEKFRDATSAAKPEEAGKIGKEIVKLRQGMLVKLDKLGKTAEKVKADWVKLEERIQKNAAK